MSNTKVSRFQFAINRWKTSESRDVLQFQYMAWPDHGIPESTAAFLKLSELADQGNVTKGPLIVHCRYCWTWLVSVLQVPELEEQEPFVQFTAS
jgi:protein tyrosine phosphatase